MELKGWLKLPFTIVDQSRIPKATVTGHFICFTLVIRALVFNGWGTKGLPVPYFCGIAEHLMNPQMSIHQKWMKRFSKY
jgi:hypothetical protein